MRRRAQDMQQPRRHEIADQHDIGRRRGCCRAAQVAMFAGVSRHQVGLARRFVAGECGRRSAVADDREGIDGCPVGGDRRQAEQNNVQGDRLDRQQSHTSPE
jgi:hypothetical protein